LLLVIFLAASGYYWLKLSQSGNIWLNHLFSALLMINLFISGGIFSIYLIWLPSSLSIESYINNTHILVYSTLTNLLSGGEGFLTNNEWTLFGALRQILELNDYGSSFLKFNIIYLVIASSALCFLRMILPGTDLKRNYLITLLAFLIGFAMDFTSTFRLKYAYSIYAIYSGIFYIFGLAYFCSLELRKLSLKPSLQLSWGGAIIFMIGCLFVAWRGDQILRNSKPILQESNYTEEEAWAMVDLYVPQYSMTVQFGHENIRSCLNAQIESFGMLSLAQVVDPPEIILDMDVSTLPSYRWLNTGSIAIPEIDPITGYPVFSPSNGGFMISDERISRIFSQENAAGSLTMSAWVRPLQEPGYQTTGGETLLFGYPNGTPALTLYMIDRKSQYRFYYGDTGVIAQPDHFSTRIWDQIVFTKTPQEIRIYLNGDLHATRPMNGSYSQPDELPGINLWNNRGSASFEIATIAFWQQALDESKIKNLFRRQLGVFNRISPIRSEDNPSCFAADDLVRYFISRGESRR
jgi:hypothetical protein